MQNNETGLQCCLSLVKSVMVLSPRGGGGNLKVLIASVDMLSCIRTAFFKNLIVRNDKPYAFETWRKGSFCKNHGH